MSTAWVVHWRFEVMAPFSPRELVTRIARYLTCPKSASGAVPDLVDGISVMTSASAFRHLDPEGHRWAVLMLPPVVTSDSLSCQRAVLALKKTDTLMASPGLTPEK